ncbi:MAG: NYN domain-containing protein [Acidobacteriota bacterium]|jgi:rRNA-processing protein FCF1|nr:NYN domain-containing protein [Acidobacteriota bacterium]
MPYWFDGNNLIGQSAADASADAGVRKAFLSTLSSLHRSGGGKFLVYFDGDDPDRATLPPGVAVRYSAPLSADDAIVRRLREIQNAGEVIVVTNDRELRTQVRNHGAKAWTWQEFTSSMRSRSTRAPMRRGMEKPIDVEEWVEYFGLDKSKI